VTPGNPSGRAAIDRSARDAAAELLEKFRSGAATNDELEDGWPTSATDVALDQIAHHLWGTYDDLKEHRLGPALPDRERNELYARTTLFLRSSLRYEWPLLRRMGLRSIVVAVLTLGLVRFAHPFGRRRFRGHGDISVWPFLDESGLQRARFELHG
jgi:hypothetical protein